MTPKEVAARLELARLELQAAVREHDGTARATVRFQAARSELVNAGRVARAIRVQSQRVAAQVELLLPERQLS